MKDDLKNGCARSCGYCDPKCRDTGLFCKEGFKRGDCFKKKHEDMMREMCKETCGWCHGFQSVTGKRKRELGDTSGNLLDFVGHSAKKRKLAHMSIEGK